MKPQDIAFGVVFLAILLVRKPKVLLIAGIVCFILAIPLFATWVFFTAERLTWYGAGFILAYLLLQLDYS